MDLLTARYAQNLTGVLSCYDRILITGTLPGACFADGMTSFLCARGIRIFDYPQFALPLRERVRDNAQALAAEHGVTIQYIAKAHPAVICPNVEPDPTEEGLKKQGTMTELVVKLPYVLVLRAGECRAAC